MNPLLVISYAYSRSLRLLTLIPFTLFWWFGRLSEMVALPFRQSLAVDNFRTQLWKDFLEKKLESSTSATRFLDRRIAFSSRGSQEFWRFRTIESKEPDTVWWLKQAAQRHPTAAFIDIGANVGIYSLAWLSISSGRAMCFEPLPGNVEALVKNFALNDFSERSEVFQTALSNDTGFVTLHSPSFTTGEGFASISDSKAVEASSRHSWQVPKSLLDDVPLPNNELVVKIDVEGHELEVIEGMKDLLNARRVVTILFERNDRQDVILDRLQSFGFGQALGAPKGGNLILDRIDSI